MTNRDLHDAFIAELAETAMPLINAKWLEMVASWEDYDGNIKTPVQHDAMMDMIKSTIADVATDGADAVKTLAALAVILQQLADLHD